MFFSLWQTDIQCTSGSWQSLPIHFPSSFFQICSFFPILLNHPHGGKTEIKEWKEETRLAVGKRKCQLSKTRNAKWITAVTTFISVKPTDTTFFPFFSARFLDRWLQQILIYFEIFFSFVMQFFFPFWTSFLSFFAFLFFFLFSFFFFFSSCFFLILKYFRGLP